MRKLNYRFSSLGKSILNKTSILILVFFYIACLSGCGDKKESLSETKVLSPDGNVSVSFSLSEKGEPSYSVYYKGKTVISPSSLGYTFKDDSLISGFAVENTKTSDFNEEWEPIWGEASKIKNNYKELIVNLKQDKEKGKKLNIVFRVFDDGIGFRYELPEQEGLSNVEIMSEETRFNFPASHQAWWEPADFESHEHLYKKSPLQEIKGANTPLTIETNDSLYVSIHEAALYDYPEMTLKASGSQQNSFVSDLVPWPDGVKVKTKAPMQSPWRTIQIATTPGGLIESYLVLNLNEPNKIKDVSWIKPMKYIGIWWGMHLGSQTWIQGPTHGATTVNMKKLIDFAEKHKIQGVLAEGWNKGWENWGSGKPLDYMAPYPDFNLQEIADYAKSKGIRFIGHHETGGNVTSYEEKMDSAFAMYESLGVHDLKTGYAGDIIPKGQHHHGQWMVNHFQRITETAAKHKLTIDSHESVKDTGIRRTWPNYMTREAARGTEWEAWSEGNPPEHTTVLPFTRGLSGPIDYTPGIFDIRYENTKNRQKWQPGDTTTKNRIHSTLAKQLALFVVLYSPMQMAGDLIENYEKNSAFKFIEDVPVNWDVTKVVDAKIGDFVTIARKNGDNWFIGSITDEQARTLAAKLSFLDEGKKYLATIYSDADNTDFENNPAAFQIKQFIVDNATTLNMKMAVGGGQAISIIPASQEEVQKITAYNP